MKYEFAPDIQKIADEVMQLVFPYLNSNRVKCYRSYGTSSKRTIARCHALGKLMQKALGVQAFYPIEFLSERFDKLNEKDKIRTIIHELMHIPKCFGGGFRHHNFVCKKNVKKYYKQYLFKKKDKQTMFKDI